MDSKILSNLRTDSTHELRAGEARYRHLSTGALVGRCKSILKAMFYHNGDDCQVRLLNYQRKLQLCDFCMKCRFGTIIFFSLMSVQPQQAGRKFF